jgi:hypothetical protein
MGKRIAIIALFLLAIVSKETYLWPSQQMAEMCWCEFYTDPPCEVPCNHGTLRPIEKDSQVEIVTGDARIDKFVLVKLAYKPWKGVITFGWIAARYLDISQ